MLAVIQAPADTVFASAPRPNACSVCIVHEHLFFSRKNPNKCLLFCAGRSTLFPTKDERRRDEAKEARHGKRRADATPAADSRLHTEVHHGKPVPAQRARNSAGSRPGLPFHRARALKRTRAKGLHTAQGCEIAGNVRGARQWCGIGQKRRYGAGRGGRGQGRRHPACQKG